MVELASVWHNKYTQSSADYFCIIHYYAFTAGNNHNQRYFVHTFHVVYCFDVVIFPEQPMILTNFHVLVSANFSRYIHVVFWWIGNNRVEDY